MDSKIQDDWDSHFEELVNFERKFGHCDVPFLWEGNKKLANWVNVQRKAKYRLSPGQRNKLCDLGFDFSISKKSWDEDFTALQKFAAEKGHIYLPVDDPAYDELRDWLLKQTIDRDYLTNERFKKLEMLGIDWTNKTTRSGRWWEMYGKLQEFKHQNGHCKVPQQWDKDLKLSNWVCVQRRMYRAGKLSADRQKKLEELGFVWDFQDIYDEQWLQHYRLLIDFKKVHGHCIVPGKKRKLASWVDRQRTLKNKGKLSEEREKSLSEIGFVWNFNRIKEKTWEQKFQQLLAYRKKFGHCQVSINSSDYKSLGYWVVSQRNLEANGRLDPEKKEKLEKVGFLWKKEVKRELYAHYENKWDSNFKKLQAYKRKWGTCQVSRKVDPPLQRWTSLQRNQYNQGKLSSQRISKLEKLGFPWDVNKAYWTKMYRALLDFHRRFGHSKVPWGWSENPHLAPWLHSLKVKKRTLDKSQKKLLDAIGFDWSLKKRKVVSWEEMYSRLITFKMRTGHTRVPVHWKEDPKLGKWVSRMRYDKQHLGNDRAELLNNIAFDWGRKDIAA